MTTRPILIADDTGGVLTGFTPEPVSLSALKAAGVSMEWPEGVAIVQEAARRLLESTSRPTATELSADNVRIDLTGAVSVPRDDVQTGAPAVFQLGTLLRDLLPDNVPVSLRLVVSQAMSNPPHYASIASFSEALSYFERPDPSSIIRGVYQRWEANVGNRPVPHIRHQSASSIEPVTGEPMVKNPRTAATATPRWLVVAGGIGLIITLTLVLAAVWLRSTDGQNFELRTKLEALTGQSTGSTTSASTAMKVDEPDVTTQVPAMAPAETAATGPARNTMRPAPDVRRNTGRPATKEVVRSANRAASTNEAGALADAAPQAPVQDNAAAVYPPVTVTILETAPGSRIYSTLDAEVAAPVSAHAKSPVVATILDDDEVITFDVVIDETGKVESVKLRRAPTSIRSTLMLTMSMSVAKAWRFQPALRNGQSVKYRQSISVPAPR